MMKKAIARERIRIKFDGKCAYCGKVLNDVFHIDHTLPVYRISEYVPGVGYRQTKEMRHPDRHEEKNMFPACPRCNNWKSTMSIEDFRFEISKQVERLRRDVAGFRLAEDFGIIKPVEIKIVFWFETFYANANIWAVENDDNKRLVRFPLSSHGWGWTFAGYDLMTRSEAKELVDIFGGRIVKYNHLTYLIEEDPMRNDA